MGCYTNSGVESSLKRPLDAHLFREPLPNLEKSVMILKLKKQQRPRVTGAMVAHRTLNPLVLGSSPRLPILTLNFVMFTRKHSCTY